MFNEIANDEMLYINVGDVWDSIIEGGKFVISTCAGYAAGLVTERILSTPSFGISTPVSVGAGILVGGVVSTVVYSKL